MLLTLLSIVSYCSEKKWADFFFFHGATAPQYARASSSFHGATAPSGLGPPHYQGFTITLRHTTLGTMSEITSTLTTLNTRNKIVGPFGSRVHKSRAAGRPGD